VHAAPLVARDPRRDADAPLHEPEAPRRALAQPLQDLGLLLRDRARVVGHAHAAHADEAALDVELGHVELPAAVQVDRPLVALGEYVAAPITPTSSAASARSSSSTIE
jgi:hypothetical protein